MYSGGMRHMGNNIVVFSKNGHMLATALNSDRATKSSRFTVLLWEVWEDPRRQSQLTLKGHTDNIIALAFTSNGKTLASGSDDKTIRLWDVSTRDSDVKSPFRQGPCSSIFNGRKNSCKHQQFQSNPTVEHFYWKTIDIS